MATPKTKTGKLAACCEIIDRYKTGDQFNPWDVLDMSNLCGCVFDCIWRTDRGMPGRHIWVWLDKKKTGNAECEMAKDRTIDAQSVYKGTWSWRASVTGYSKGKNVIKAMRLAIRAGTFGAFKKSSSCNYCGALDHLSVDHKSVAFQTIAENHIAEFGNPLIENDSDGGWSMQSPIAFIAYHDALADYQTLCRSCNSRKGKL